MSREKTTLDPWTGEVTLFEEPAGDRGEDNLIALANAFLALRNSEGWGLVSEWLRVRPQKVLEDGLVASGQEGYKSDFYLGRLAEAKSLLADMQRVIDQGREAIFRRADLEQELLTSRRRGTGASEMVGEGGEFDTP